jgi:shikimate kinase
MVVIHIAGTTGSGKSWTGDLMKRIYPDSRLHVIDLDAIFKEAIKKSIGIKAADAKFQSIQKHVQTYIAHERARHKNLLITGYSDVLIDGKIRYVELDADYKFFIELPVDQLIQQYRNRASHYIRLTSDEVHTLSDAAIRKMVQDDRRIYKSFRRMPQLRIIKEIIIHIGK